MTVEECLKLLRQVKDVAFASVDEHDMPQVRIIDVMIVEDSKLYFCTARGKNFYREITARPMVAVTAMNKQYQMVRLNGHVEKMDGQKHWIDRIFMENPAMEGVYPGDNRYVLEAFCLIPDAMEYFDLGREPVERGVVIGAQKSGYFITDACIGCNTCAVNCPQQCIAPGQPYVIAQEHCLHCGLCYENCPVHAIKRREE